MMFVVMLPSVADALRQIVEKVDSSSDAVIDFAEVADIAHNSSDGPSCKALGKRLSDLGGKLKPYGCQQPGVFCCDSWMMEFVREVKSEMMFDPVKVQMVKWTVRPGKDHKRQAHFSSILHKRAGKIGKDTHYFTVVQYCGDQYMVFDTVDKSGRKVSTDFLTDQGKLAKDFEFETSALLTEPPKTCTYNECVRNCRSQWLAPTGIKQAMVPKCLIGIVL